MALNERLHKAILGGDRIVARNTVNEALEDGVRPLDLLHETMIPAMEELGDLFEQGEVLVPDLLVGARAMQTGLNILEPLITQDIEEKRSKLCIGTVEGDNHDIGKNIVALLLRAAGYEVDDLGIDCGVEKFEEAVRGGAKAVLCSCLTSLHVGHVAEIVKHFGDRPHIPVVIGGGAVSEQYAQEIGDKAYGASANDAVRILNNLLG